MKTALKYIGYIVIMTAVAFALELLVFNFHPLLSGGGTDLSYDTVNMSGDPGISYSLDEKSATITLDEPVYIKKLYVNMTSDAEQKYFMDVRYITEFGVGKEEEIIDLYYPEFGVGVTNVNRLVSSIRITYTFGDPVTITNFRILNRLEINRYRILFFMLVQFMILLFIKCRKVFTRKPENFMAFACLLLGSYIIFCQGINENGWDEQVHFATVYNLSFFGDTIETNPTYEIMRERVPENYYNTNEEKEMATQYLNVSYLDKTETPREISFSLTKIGHCIQAFAVFLGRISHLSFNRIYMAGKFANLLTYIVLMYWTIRLMPRRKWEVTALALTPTQVFIASTYTYDVTVNGFLFLGFALWMKVMEEEKIKNGIFLIFGCILAFCIGSLSKAVYIPLVLLCLCIPKRKFGAERIYKAFWICAIIVFAGVMASFVVPMIIHVMNQMVGQFSDVRIEGSDQVLQMQTILSHLPQYLKMLLTQIISSAGQLFAGHEGLANFGRLKELDSRLYFITAAWFYVVLLGNQERRVIQMQTKIKIVLGVVMFIVMILIATSMYLAATSVGEESIAGIQARYYFPLFLPLMLILSNQTIKITVADKLYHRLILGIPIGILLCGIYLNMLSPWCF